MPTIWYGYINQMTGNWHPIYSVASLKVSYYQGLGSNRHFHTLCPAKRQDNFGDKLNGPNNIGWFYKKCRGQAFFDTEKENFLNIYGQ